MKYLLIAMAVSIMLTFEATYPTANAEMPSLTEQMKIPSFVTQAHKETAYSNCLCCHDPGYGC